MLALGRRPYTTPCSGIDTNILHWAPPGSSSVDVFLCGRQDNNRPKAKIQDGDWSRSKSLLEMKRSHSACPLFKTDQTDPTVVEVARWATQVRTPTKSTTFPAPTKGQPLDAIDTKVTCAHPFSLRPAWPKVRMSNEALVRGNTSKVATESMFNMSSKKKYLARSSKTFSCDEHSKETSTKAKPISTLCQCKSPGGTSARKAGKPIRPDTLPRKSCAHLEGDGNAIAHGKISTTALSISDELSSLIDGMHDDSQIADFANEVCALNNISSTVRGLSKQLGHDGAAGVSADSSIVRSVPYNDWTLERARHLTSMMLKQHEDLKVVTNDYCDQRLNTFIPNESLEEISAANRLVQENMASIMSQSWCSGVFATASVSGSTDIVEKEMPTKIAQAQDAQNARSSVSADAVDGETKQRISQRQINRNATQQVESEKTSTEFPSSDEISQQEMMKLQLGFRRFKIPDSNDLHVTDVKGLLEYFGHVLTSESIIDPLIKDVTSYDYMDFDEFLSFLERYVPKEREEFRRVFDLFDEDCSSTIENNELRKVLGDLGFIPRYTMITEALKVADKTGTGELGFDEFVKFIAAYRKNEGFSESEVDDLEILFDKNAMGEPPTFPAEHLAPALVYFFGVHVCDIAEKISDNLKSGRGLQKSAYAVQSNSGKPESLSFDEFLIFARKTRDASYVRWKGSNMIDDPAAIQKQIFGTVDANDSGTIDEQELRLLLEKLGFVPLKMNIEETLTKVDKNKDRLLDFGEFFDFIETWQRQEGFLDEEASALKEVFDRFDEDDSGDVNILELADLLRELGYNETLEEIRVFLLEVDASGDNSLDFPEYMRLMRLHRHTELTKLLDIFKQFAENDHGVLSGTDVRRALQVAGYTPSYTVLRKHANVPNDFDGFVELCDSCRAEITAKEKKKAGFSDAQIEKFRETFNQFDKDRSCELDANEVVGLAKEFGFAPTNREEQQTFIKKMDVARERAKNAGVKDTGSKDGMPFWVFVQLARIMQSDHDQAEEKRKEKLMSELEFSDREVEEFRTIYNDKRVVIKDEFENETEGLPRQSIRRLLYVIGIEIKAEKKVQLDEQLDRLGCPADDGLLEFFGFLRLMRFLVDSSWMT